MNRHINQQNASSGYAYIDCMHHFNDGKLDVSATLLKQEYCLNPKTLLWKENKLEFNFLAMLTKLLPM